MHDGVLKCVLLFFFVFSVLGFGVFVRGCTSAQYDSMHAYIEHVTASPSVKAICSRYRLRFFSFSAHMGVEA